MPGNPARRQRGYVDPGSIKIADQKYVDAAVQAARAQGSAPAAVSSGSGSGGGGGGAPSGSAGGDLNGTYPNPGVDDSIVARALGWKNVVDYGATGDGSTDDSTAIDAAFTALVDGDTLYFPPGTYIWDGSGQLNTRNNITIIGAGMGVTILKGPTGGAVMIWVNAPNANNWNIQNLTLDANYTARSSGNHCLYLECSQCVVDHVEVLNAGQFAIMVEDPDDDQNEFRDIQITNCRVKNCFADGIHVKEGQNVVIANNVIDGSDDDCIAVFESTDVVIANNVCRSRTDLATSWGRGICVLEGCNQVVVSGNVVTNIKQTGILVYEDGSGNRPANVTLIGNYIGEGVASSSDYGIRIQKADSINVIDNVIEDIDGTFGIYLADVNNLLIQGGAIRQNGVSGFVSIGVDTGSSWATTWSRWVIQGVHIQGLNSGMGVSVNIEPHSTITVADLIIAGLVVNQAKTGNYIYTNRLSGTCKIVNNTELNGRTIGNGGSGSTPTTANNN